MKVNVARMIKREGKFWPIVHNSLIFSLVFMHAVAVEIFTMKKLYPPFFLLQMQVLIALLLPVKFQIKASLFSDIDSFGMLSEGICT